MFNLRLLFRVLTLIIVLLGLVLAVVLYYVANPKLPFYTPLSRCIT